MSKQHTNILKRFRKEIDVIDEDVKQAGRDLATCVIRSIEGVPAGELQFLSFPGLEQEGQEGNVNVTPPIVSAL